MNVGIKKFFLLEVVICKLYFSPLNDCCLVSTGLLLTLSLSLSFSLYSELFTTIIGYGRGSTKSIALHLVVHPQQGGFVQQPQSVPIAYASAPPPQQAYGQQPAYGQPQPAYGQPAYGQAPVAAIQMAPVAAVAYPTTQKMDL